MESQAGMAGLQGYAAKPATADQAPAAQVTQAAADRPNPEKHYLGLGLHA